MENFKLTDIWRIKNPTKRQYTWISNTTPKIMCRLDFILISDSLQGYYENSDIIPGYLTDHSCTTLKLSFHDNQRGRGFWKYNKTLNQDKKLKEQLEKTIEDTITENEGANDGLIWDLMKCKIRGTCIKRGITLNRDKRNRQDNLNKQLTTQENRIQEEILKNTNSQIIEELEREKNNTKTELDELIAERTRGAALRSRAEWHEEGNKASKLFLNLEKSRGNSKTIKKLKSETGEIITDQNEILKMESKFYKDLFKSKAQNKDHQTRKEEEKLFNTTGDKIKDEHHELLTKPIEEKEIWNIIKNNPADKSPGTDGLNNEFYREHWPLIKEYVINSMNYGLDTGQLCLSQRRGVISLIPKPQKNLEELKNWRPITLLNQDYKYLTKAIANRIQNLLPEIINSDQGGFVPGRYIGCNIQRIMNTFELCKEEQKKGALINIDFEKAFDTLEWDHMLKSLEYLNFPEKTIKWIKTIYTNIETCIINNGFTTEYLKPERGVRQGCPLSPYLFIITMEVFNRWIRKKMEGYELRDNRNNTYLINQFADDTSFAVKAEYNAIHQLFAKLKQYSSMSGLKLNLDKTEIILMGETSEMDIPNRYRKNIKEETKYLGAVLNTNNRKTTERNIEEARKKITGLITQWQKRHMPISGKIAIIKSILVPQLTYHLSTLTSPEKKVVKEINRSLYKFINNNGSEKIKINIMISPYEKGGYKMIDLDSYIKAIKIRWIERLISVEGVWKKYITDKLGPDIEYVTRCNIRYEDLPFKIPKENMWNEVWKTWCTENFYNPELLDEILNQSLWWNSHIKINGKPLFNKIWYNAGIRWLQDILMENNEGRRWKTKEEIRAEYNLTIKTMDYNSIKSAVPRVWKQAIRNDQEMEDEEEYKLIDQIKDSKKPTKYMYEELIKGKKEEPIKAMNKWRRDMANNMENNRILKGHIQNHWCTLNNKIRSYNFNFLNRNIPYNKKLMDMKKKPDAKCNTCGGIETLIHMYWYCPAKFTLWMHLSDLHTRLTGKQMEITKEYCLLGVPTNPENIKKNKQENLLNLLVKHYIHLCKCSEDVQTSKTGLELYIKSTLRIEKECARNKGTLEIFENTWNEWSEWTG
jgi:hypothetical protein